MFIFHFMLGMEMTEEGFILLVAQVIRNDSARFWLETEHVFGLTVQNDRAQNMQEWQIFSPFDLQQDSQRKDHRRRKRCERRFGECHKANRRAGWTSYRQPILRKDTGAVYIKNIWLSLFICMIMLYFLDLFIFHKQLNINVYRM